MPLVGAGRAEFGIVDRDRIVDEEDGRKALVRQPLEAIRFVELGVRAMKIDALAADPPIEPHRTAQHVAGGKDERLAQKRARLAGLDEPAGAIGTQVDRRLESLSGLGGDDSADVGDVDGDESPAAYAAEVELRRRVIAAERDELERMVARRKVTPHVAAEVSAALDVDETTMRP